MITIYGKSNCPYCKKAIKYCEVYDLPYEYIDIEKKESWFKEYLKNVSKMTTVPIIYENKDKLIGGYNELVNYYKE